MAKFGDTPAFNKPHLCETCANGTVMNGVSYQEKRTDCARTGEIVPFKVIECSGYSDKSKPNLYQMQQIAWRIASDKKTKKIGFYAPQKYFKMVNEDQIDPLDSGGDIE